MSLKYKKCCIINLNTMKRRILAFFDKVWIDISEDSLDSQKVLEAHKEVSHDKGYPTKLDFKDMFKLELEVVHIEMARIKHSIYIFLFLSLFLFLISLLLKVCNYSPKFSVVCACAGFIMSVCMFFHIYSFTERYKELRKALMRFYERKERYIKSFDCDMTSNFYNICGTNNSYEIMDVRWGYYVISIVYIVLYLWYFIYLIR